MSQFTQTDYESLKNLIQQRYLELVITYGSNWNSDNIQLKTGVPLDTKAETGKSVPIFLSYFDKVYLDTAEQKNFLVKALRVPQGFLHNRGKKNSVKNENKDQTNLGFDVPSHETAPTLFPGLRNAFLHTVEVLRAEKSGLLSEWFSFIKEKETLSRLESGLITSCVKEEAFPAAPLTGKRASFNKAKLQYVFFAQFLRDCFLDEAFPEGSEESIETYREWVQQFDPDRDGEFPALLVPQRFKQEVNVILGYQMALKLHMEDSKASLPLGFLSKEIDSAYKDNYFKEDSESGADKALLLSYTLLFLGLFHRRYEKVWHTQVSRPVMGFIEEKAYELIHNKPSLRFFTELKAADLMAAVGADAKTAFKAFSEVVTNEGNITQKGTNAEKVKQEYGSRRLFMSTLILFVRSRYYLNDLRPVIETSEVRNMLIIRYYDGFTLENPSEKLNIDSVNASLAASFKEKKINCKVISKNIEAKSNKDTINNIKGFCNELGIRDASGLRFDSDSTDEKIRENELMCIVHAFHPLPLFDENEDYFFV
ncbi:MAG: hypothetical protein LAT75_10115 [Candidatus Cyclonatronum sp.]|uniref:hypothetical protein n=1 Tax=Cyclonatronum sp. TaxID=3024185 RepID=UPI0025BCE1A9|nr:hypothetical protein [Cyclonatronum sp.]MCH8487214.1 hypothetical protein [Cyclonatronum sp.]